MAKRILLLLMMFTLSQIADIPIFGQPQMYQLDKNGINKNISVDNIFKDSKTSKGKNHSIKYSVINAEAKITQRVEKTENIRKVEIADDIKEENQKTVADIKKELTKETPKENLVKVQAVKKSNTVIPKKKIQPQKKIKPLSKRKYISKKTIKKRIKRKLYYKKHRSRKFASRKYKTKKYKQKKKHKTYLKTACQVKSSSSLYCKYKSQGKDYMAWIFKPDVKTQYKTKENLDSCSGSFTEERVDSTYQRLKNEGAKTAWIFKPAKPYSQYGDSNSCERGELVYVNS